MLRTPALTLTLSITALFALGAQPLGAQTLGANGLLGKRTETTQLANPAGGAEDRFGGSLALLGSRLMVGHPGDDSSLADAGAVRLYTESGGTWAPSGTLLPSDLDAGQAFGQSLALDSSSSPARLVVGSPFDADLAPQRGAVYVFEDDGAGGWTEVAKLEPTAAPLEAIAFGAAVAIEGDTLVVGAPFESNTIGAFVGNAYVFERTGGTWTERARLTPDVAPSGAVFGTAVDVQGDLILVGAPYLGLAHLPGRAFAFERTGGLWSLEQGFLAPAFTGRDRFGTSLSLVGQRAFFGSPRDLPIGVGWSLARVPAPGGASWQELDFFHLPLPSRHDRFGAALATRAGELLVGAPGSGERPGCATLWRDVAGTPALYRKLVASDGLPSDGFGSALAFDERWLAIGAPYRDLPAESAGAVYLFRR